MQELLNKIISDTSDYRESVDKIFSTTTLHGCFSEILMRTSELYLDYRLFIKYLPDLEAASIDGDDHDVFHTNRGREREFRQRLTKGLELSHQWTLFKPIVALSSLIGLRTQQDYLNNFRLHLPEIYEETFRVEECVTAFSASRQSSVLAALTISFQHMGRNHILFLMPALEWAADEDSWEEA